MAEGSRAVPQAGQAFERIPTGRPQDGHVDGRPRSNPSITLLLLILRAVAGFFRRVDVVIFFFVAVMSSISPSSFAVTPSGLEKRFPAATCRRP